MPFSTNLSSVITEVKGLVIEFLSSFLHLYDQICMSVLTSSLGLFFSSDCLKDYLALLKVCLVRANGYSFKDSEADFNAISSQRADRCNFQAHSFVYLLSQGYSFKDRKAGFNGIFISDWLLANVR